MKIVKNYSLQKRNQPVNISSTFLNILYNIEYDSISKLFVKK